VEGSGRREQQEARTQQGTGALEADLHREVGGGMVQCESTAASDRIGCLTPPWALWLNAEICSRSWKRGTEAPQIPPSRGLTVRDQELRPEARGEKRRAGWAPSSPPW
jgi:hypothetical protein